MAYVAGLTFNPFQENTYIVYDDTKDCIIFDPGCSNTSEEQELIQFIESNKLKPVRLINTHCHIDHVLGNAFIAEKYQLSLEIHEGELEVLKSAPVVAQMYGLPVPAPAPEPLQFIKEGDIVEFGETRLEAIFTPGHSPASLSFYCKESQFVIAGDVLFQGSIGRTDLPGGNYDLLIKNVKEKLFPLGDEVKVYPGHGPSTTIGIEKKTNPFF